jgi:hypothetical protein
MTVFCSVPSEASPSIIRAKTPILAGALEPVALRLLDPTASIGCTGSWVGRIPVARRTTASHCD